VPASLSSCADPLATSFDVALLDLDGVVYVGKDAVPGAPEALRSARGLGMRLAFVTNNAARPPIVVAEHLTSLGIPAAAEDVITSSHAAAHYLSDRLPAGSAVLVVGTTGLIDALVERGLRPVHSADDQPVAVVQGYSPDLDWRQLAEGAVAIRSGVPWVATNLDSTVPSPRGPLPGNGSLVAALQHATGVVPVATGKPDPTMHRESVQRSHAQRPLVVGDRLDTDIEGATAVGCPSLLVFSGVTTPADVLVAPREQRPDFLAHDVAGLLHSHTTATLGDGGARCGQWHAIAQGDELRLECEPAAAGSPPDDLDPLRALCAAAWHASDATASAPSWRCTAEDDQVAAVLRRLELG
jgi:glycerol 3-phosphatase-2